MKDGKPNNADAQEGRQQGPPPRRNGGRSNKQRGFVERATACGHSGYGSESVRPHLRDQLRLKALLPSPFPPPEQQPNKDDHHL